MERETLNRRFGSERDVYQITGIRPKTLQKDRLLGRERFPHYKAGGKILYDLQEVEAIIRGTASNGGAVA